MQVMSIFQKEYSDLLIKEGYVKLINNDKSQDIYVKENVNGVKHIVRVCFDHSSYAIFTSFKSEHSFDNQSVSGGDSKKVIEDFKALINYAKKYDESCFGIPHEIKYGKTFLDKYK